MRVKQVRPGDDSSGNLSALVPTLGRLLLVRERSRPRLPRYLGSSFKGLIPRRRATLNSLPSLVPHLLHSYLIHTPLPGLSCCFAHHSLFSLFHIFYAAIDWRPFFPTHSCLRRFVPSPPRPEPSTICAQRTQTESICPRPLDRQSPHLHNLPFRAILLRSSQIQSWGRP